MQTTTAVNVSALTRKLELANIYTQGLQLYMLSKCTRNPACFMIYGHVLVTQISCKAEIQMLYYIRQTLTLCNIQK